MPHFLHQPSRRHVIHSLAAGSLLLPGMLSELLANQDPAPIDPTAPKPSHFAPRAKRVIFLFMTGGVSHLETFDPKPKLAADAGKKHNGKTLLAGRIKSFEAAFGMQSAMPDVLDLSSESDATLALYGLERGATSGFGWQCLVARRMSERGVRSVELIDSGSSNNWDAHNSMKEHVPKAKGVDRAIAGLLKDLKSRGMLDETLVVWTTEFGRTPHTDGPTGRSHHPDVFCSWLAGGGVKGGIAHGTSDDYGYHPAENPVHLNDFHATILHLLGLDHERLTYRHAGRDFASPTSAAA